jgi:6-phosphogluconolactonase (cycloisomerase 2 family)
MALVVSVAMGLGMTSCGGGTIGFMWVLGTQYNKIGGFKIDDRTGNLTGIVGSPFASGGTNPVMLTIQSGGRYLYVLNAGDSSGKTGNISLFSVGGDGTLSYQNSYASQGTFPVWIATDSTNSYLYVLNQRSSAYDGVTDFNGSITVFPLDPNTGVPVVAQAASFEVGKSPTQMSVSATCIYTLDSGDQTIFPSSLNSSTGQLTSNPAVALGTFNATSVNVAGSSIYVTDAGQMIGGTGSILTLTPGGSCAQLAVGATIANLPTASNPVQTLAFAGASANYLYVLNHSTQNTNYANSSISAFRVDPTTGLQPLDPSVAPNNPFGVGSGPVCMAIDPTNQYIYNSDQYSSTVTGYRLSPQFGTFTALQKGSNFPTVGTPSCLVISKNTAY